MEGFIDATWMLDDHKCGVYALFYEEECVYVGKSTRILRRIRKHKSTGKIRFNKIMIRFCEQAELDTLEYFYINKLRPIYNSTDKLDASVLGLIDRLKDDTK